MTEVELLIDAHAELGEGPVWDARANRLYWVDIHAGILHQYDPVAAVDTQTPLGEPVGCVAPAQEGIIAALKSGVVLINLTTGARTPLVGPEAHLPNNRPNDGKCDPVGRFIFGTMDDAEQDASGSLYALSPDGSCKTLVSHVRISNGLAWSPDNKTLYYIDTPTREVAAFDYDLIQGSIAHKRVVIKVPESLGWPDGMTVDVEGMLWIALWGGAAVGRFDPTSGTLLQKINVPALHVTSCTFGGPDFTHLYITSARKGVNDEQLARYPHTGGLFRLQTNVAGTPAVQFGATPITV